MIHLKYQEEEGVFVSCDYEKVDSEEVDPLTTSVHGNDTFEGTTEGPCPFMVHELTGEQFSSMNKTQMKAAALKHLKSNGKVLYISHAEKPQDTFYNPRLFPSMFPHLFPFGLGGIQNTRHVGNISSKAHKEHLLMYYDKHFQLDSNFALIAFNMEQIKQSSTEGGHVLASHKNIQSIIQRIK